MKHVAWSLVLVACSVHAEFKDGNKLYADMTGSAAHQMHAMGYVMGVADALAGVTVCAPSNVSAGQVFDMVKMYLEEQPQLRHFMGDALVNRVLSKAWPCRNNRGGSNL